MKDPMYLLKYATPGRVLTGIRVVSEEEARQLLEKYYDAFPELLKYRDSQGESSKPRHADVD